MRIHLRPLPPSMTVAEIRAVIADADRVCAEEFSPDCHAPGLELVTPETLRRDGPARREAKEKRAAEIFNAIPLPAEMITFRAIEVTNDQELRAALIEIAVRNTYPFSLQVASTDGDVTKIRRAWDSDDLVLMERPWIVDAIRAEFRRLAAQ